MHSNGKLKQQIADNLEHFVIHEPSVVHGLKRYTRFKKKIFILTNSDYHYTKLLLDYAINPFLDKGETWQDLFDICNYPGLQATILLR